MAGFLFLVRAAAAILAGDALTDSSGDALTDSNGDMLTAE